MLPKAVTFGVGPMRHLWAVERSRAKGHLLFSMSTRPVSWLGSKYLGTHPRTKGTRLFHRPGTGNEYRLPRGVSWHLVVASRARCQEIPPNMRKSTDHMGGHSTAHLRDRPSRPV